MCGIIGYTGRSNAVPYLIEGLKNLEYRGYDSSGIAIADTDGISVMKRKGKVAVLEQAIGGDFTACTGIGHTRWATHGKASDLNAHPHLSETGMFAVVHNGIIENCSELKAKLENEGCSFLSDTDTEVISQLLESNFKGDLLSCLKESVKALNGSFAIAVLHRDFPHIILCARKNSPLLVATGKDGSFVFSDTIAVQRYISSYYTLGEDELALITRRNVRFFSCSGEEISKTATAFIADKDRSDRGCFPHYMLKEIYEQPEVLKSTLDCYIKNGTIVFDNLSLTDAEIKNIRHIYIVACGSAYHAGVCAEKLMRKLTGLPVCTCIASEFPYDSITPDSHCLVMAVSQSGETADTLSALSYAKEKGAHTVAIVNVRNSAMTKYADSVILTLADREIAVATTKAYTCQLGVLYLLSCFFAEKRRNINCSDFIKGLMTVPDTIKEILVKNEDFALTAEKLQNSEHIYFIGRGTDYALSMEGALKMKEISYIHCEAYAAGELKHGTISLIEKGTPVIAVCLRDDIFTKTRNAIREVTARGAFVIALTDESHRHLLEDAHIILSVPDAKNDYISAFHGIVPLQLLSYHTAVKKGTDVDKPRNLAKSVTVE